MKLRLGMGAAIMAITCFASGARGGEAPANGTAASTSAAAAPAPATTTELTPAAPKRTLWPWILMGTGVALIVTATVLEVNAVSEDDKSTAENVKLFPLTSRPDSDPEKKALQASVDDHAKSASHERTAALIVGTVGFLAVAGSVVLWFFEGRSSSPSPAAKLSPSLVPSFGPSYAGATLGASF